jgi:hypothetical protein
MGKTLKYVSEFTFPSSNSKPMATGYAKGGMAMGGMKSTKPAASPAPKSDMLYSKKENNAKTLLSDGKGAPMPHAKGSVNMAKGGKVNMAAGGPAMSPAQAAMARVQASRQVPQAPANVKPPMPQMGGGAPAPANQQQLANMQRLAAQVQGPATMPRLPQSMPGTTPNGIMPGGAPGTQVMPGMGNRPQVSQPLMPGGAADQMRPAVMKRGGMAKVGKVMGEFKAGELHSGSKSGPVVKSRKQAVAIGMSEARKASKK